MFCGQTLLRTVSDRLQSHNQWSAATNARKDFRFRWIEWQAVFFPSLRSELDLEVADVGIFGTKIGYWWKNFFILIIWQMFRTYSCRHFLNTHYGSYLGRIFSRNNTSSSATVKKQKSSTGYAYNRQMHILKQGIAKKQF